MNANEFNGLAYKEKTEAILTGTFLSYRLTDQYYIKLYNLDKFYVEVFFEDRSHLITHFWAFENTQYVLHYLKNLKIAV